MKQFQTTILIHAAVETVWRLLTDAAHYPGWNSTIESIEGRIVQGGRIKVHVRAAPGQTFRLKVTGFAAPRKMVWTGGMPLGLFTGKRVFSLTEAEGAVRFAMDERFTGPLAPMIARSIPDLQQSFDLFAADLKRAAEHA